MTFIDQLHTELANQGRPDLRPTLVYARQAIGSSGATASDVGRTTPTTPGARPCVSPTGASRP